MGVQLQVVGPRGPLPEGGGHQTRSADLAVPAGTPPREGGTCLHVADGVGDCFVVCLTHGLGVIVWRQAVEEAHRPGSRQAQVEAGASGVRAKPGNL